MSMKQSSTKLVAQGYTQVEWIDYDETFAPISNLEFFSYTAYNSLSIEF